MNSAPNVFMLILLWFFLSFQGLPYLPYLGSYPVFLWENPSNVTGAIIKLNQKYGSIVGFYIGGVPSIIVGGFNNVKQILTRPEFQGRPGGFVIETRSFFQTLGKYYLIL